MPTDMGEPPSNVMPLEGALLEAGRVRANDLRRTLWRNEPKRSDDAKADAEMREDS